MRLSTSPAVSVAALYHFAPLPDPHALRDRLRALCQEAGIRGTLLLASEGVNGTIAGPADGIGTVLAYLRALPGFASLRAKHSQAHEMPFHRLKVRVKREIVTMGVEDIDPVHQAGRYVAPADWNALIADPQTVVVDVRNGYETAIGTFEGAVDPQTASFTEFPAWVEANRAALQGKAVAMYCTGGIRCEKATAFMRSRGFDEVYHLEGGILAYLEQVPAGQSLWQGECFVFDERVSVTHGLQEGDAELCRACRHPLTVEDRAHADFVAGISCPHCRDARSEEDRRRYAERHRQVLLAASRGKGRHIGS